MSLAIKAAGGGGGTLGPRALGPSFGIFDVFKKIGGAIVGGVKGLATGGPLGAIGGAISGAIGGPSRTTGGKIVGTPPISPVIERRQPTGLFEPVVGRPPVRVLPGQGAMMSGPFPQNLPQERLGPLVIEPGAILPGGRPFISRREDGAIGCPSGFRPNKTDYFLRDGTFVPRGTRCVKVRRRNSLNPRALDRAISRVEGAKRASRKLSRITVRKKC